MAKLVLILDTTGFLAKQHLYILDAEIYTVPRVVEEVRDRSNREALEIGIAIGRVNIVEPSRDAREKVLMKARETGEYISLSDTDIDVAALAYMLRDKGKVVVITDDYALQNLLLHLGIPYKPLRTTGIREIRRYIVYCSRCGYVSINRDEEVCPICGYPLKKKVS